MSLAGSKLSGWASALYGGWTFLCRVSPSPLLSWAAQGLLQRFPGGQDGCLWTAWDSPLTPSHRLSSLEVSSQQSFVQGWTGGDGRGCHLLEDPWGCEGESQLLGPARKEGPFSPELCPMVTAHPQPPPPAPACVNFSNICFPWALVGLGWEGTEFLRLPEGTLSAVHPCRLPSAEEALSELPLGFQPSKATLGDGAGSLPSLFPWD